MFWSRKPKTIRVELYDAATGQCFARSETPPERLPESFEAATTLHLDNGDRDVERADPVTAAEFRRTGKLRLVLRKVCVERVDPEEVLFSLPTISDGLPAIQPGSTKLGYDVLELGEDDWRQREFVSAGLYGVAESELAAIREIYERHRVGSGFDQLHPRTALAAPLDGADLTLASLRQAVGPRATWLAGIAFHGVAGLVADGFAVRLPSSLEFYGLRVDSRITALAVAGRCGNNVAAADLDALAAFAASHNLYLVDWCRATLASPDAPGFAELLRR
jgi:hypothetical protein